MKYDSLAVIESRTVPGVTFSVVRMSYRRRVDLMRKIRELARRHEFLSASEQVGDKMDGALIEAEIHDVYFKWGLESVSGLAIDGEEATPGLLAEKGPEELYREALAAVIAETKLSQDERKN
jgi:hypothetical protein